MLIVHKIVFYRFVKVLNFVVDNKLWIDDDHDEIIFWKYYFFLRYFITVLHKTTMGKIYLCLIIVVSILFY